MKKFKLYLKVAFVAISIALAVVVENENFTAVIHIEYAEEA